MAEGYTYINGITVNNLCS